MQQFDLGTPQSEWGEITSELSNQSRSRSKQIRARSQSSRGLSAAAAEEESKRSNSAEHPGVLG